MVVVDPPPPAPLPLPSALVPSLAAAEELVIEDRCSSCVVAFAEVGEAEGSAASRILLSLPSPAYNSAGTEVVAKEGEALPPPLLAPDTVATAAVEMTAVAVPATSTSEARMPTFSLSGPPPAAAAAAAAATKVAAVPLLERADLFLLPLLDLALLEPPWWWWCSCPWWPWRWWCEDEEALPMPTSDRECLLSSLLVRKVSPLIYFLWSMLIIYHVILIYE